MKRHLLSENELAVLRALWSADAPLSSPQLLERMPQNDWNPRSVYSVLNSLIGREYVRVAGVARCGRVYGRTYEALISPADCLSGMAESVLPQDEPWVSVVAAMARGRHITRDTLDQLQQMLDQKRRELDGSPDGKE